MRYRLPFMVEDLEHHQWFNWGPPPPGTEVGGTAVTHNRYGKGQSVYVGVPIFWAMQWRPFWVRSWIPQLMREILPDPIAEIRVDPHSDYVHGTFFYERSRKFILVQLLNTVELATDGEFRPVAKVELRINPEKLKLSGARVVWPEEKDLELNKRGNKVHIVLPNPPRYTALFLELAPS